MSFRSYLCSKEVECLRFLLPTQKQNGVSSHGRYPLPEESSHRVGRGRCVVDGMANSGLRLHTLYHFRLLPAIGLALLSRRNQNVIVWTGVLQPKVDSW